MKTYPIRTAAACLAFVALLVGGLRAGGVSAATSTDLTINHATHEVTAASGFTPDEVVVLWYNLPDGTAAFLTQTDALASGGLDFTIDQDTWDTIPADATSIVAHGDSSGTEAIYQIQHPGPEVLSLDTSTMTATAGPNFTPDEPIVVWYNLPDGSAVFVDRIDAQADGSINWTIDADDWALIPSNATSLVAHGDISGVDAVYIYTH